MEKLSSTTHPHGSVPGSMRDGREGATRTHADRLARRTPNHVPTPDGELRPIIEHIATARRLLVASDFDGVIAPIVGDPAAATADTDTLNALRQLAWMPRTRAAIVSGRSLTDLRRRLSIADGIMLVGSHGAELLGQVAPTLTPPVRSSLQSLPVVLHEIAASVSGSRVEIKSRGIAFHYRGVHEKDIAASVERVLQLQTLFPAMGIRLGSMVIEFVADACTKGDGLRSVRHRVGASAVIFVGDDLTDEDAFATLSAEDAGVKVGPGETVARYRLSTAAQVGPLLIALAGARAAWIESRPSGRASSAHGE